MEELKEYTDKQLKEYVKHFKAEIKHKSKIEYEWQDVIRCKHVLKLIEEEIARRKQQEIALRQVIEDNLREGELQHIPDLTKRLSFIKSKRHFTNQEMIALEHMREHCGTTDTYTLSDETGMHLRSAGRCLSVLNKRGVIKPKTVKLSPYGKHVTVYEIDSEIISA